MTRERGLTATERAGLVVALEAERDRYRELLSEAEGWCEEIQHAGYSVPMGRGEAFVDFWVRLQREVG